jgi:hypothetical protein
MPQRQQQHPLQQVVLSLTAALPAPSCLHSQMLLLLLLHRGPPWRC